MPPQNFFFFRKNINFLVVVADNKEARALCYQGGGSTKPWDFAQLAKKQIAIGT